jgi:glyoxylase-like metal-dependent hydrolase (beta-lactamase superfamily II)
MKPEQIEDGIFLIGGSDISESRDCMVYLLNFGELVMIDTGAGPGVSMIIANIRHLGFDPSRLSTVILTHCHIDHVGGAHELKKLYGARIIMHQLDADVVERGDTKMTAAYWYGLPFSPLRIDTKLSGEEERLTFGQQELVCLHTPGHTPGSISVYLDMSGKRIVFGQDIHGPFLVEFGSNIDHWQTSMEKLLDLKPDVLCEGHFGVYRSKKRVADYIERYLGEYGNRPLR